MDKINISYNRKSTEDKNRQIQSIDDQLKVNRETAVRYDEKIIKEIIEEKSGKTPYKRPEFSKMMEMIYSEKINNIYCWKLDRLSRNMAEGGMIIQALQSGLINSIITPDRTFSPNDNAVVIAVEFGIANEDIRRLSTNVKRGHRSKNEKGWMPGEAPMGYENEIYARKGEKRILPHPKEFKLIRMVFDKALTGLYSMVDLAEYATELSIKPKRGGKIIAPSTIYRLLTNKFYYGEYIHGGKLWKGVHTTMITTDEYDKIQQILGQRGRPRESSHINKYNGLIVCGECGFAVTPEPLKYKKIKSTGELRSYKYWRCTHKSKKQKCSQKSIREEELETQLFQFLDDIELDEKFIQWGLSYIEEYAQAEIQDRSTIENAQKEQLTDAQTQLDNLVKLFINPKNVDRSMLAEEDYIRQKKELQENKDKTIKMITHLSDRQNEAICIMERDMNVCLEIVKEFNSGDREKKRQYLSDLARTIVLIDGKVGIQAGLTFIKIKNIKRQSKENPGWLELTPASRNKDFQLFQRIYAVWSGRRDSNSRSSVWKTDILPLNYARKIKEIVH